jgi:hypothetical protein
MISLKDTAKKELISGKKLFEKLKLKNIKSDTIDLDIPKFEFGEMSDEVYNITLPNKKYFIYKDYYRSKRAHLASIDDMCVNFSMFFSDFEDFDPQKDILFASDDYKEIAEWYIKNVFNYKLPSSKDKWDDWYSNLDERKAKYKYHDSEYFIFHLLFDEEKIDQYYNDKEQFNSKTLKEIIQQYF